MEQTKNEILQTLSLLRKRLTKQKTEPHETQALIEVLRQLERVENEGRVVFRTADKRMPTLG